MEKKQTIQLVDYCISYLNDRIEKTTKIYLIKSYEVIWNTKKELDSITEHIKTIEIQKNTTKNIHNIWTEARMFYLYKSGVNIQDLALMFKVTQRRVKYILKD